MWWLIATAVFVAAVAALGPRLLRRGTPADPIPEDPGGPDPDYVVEIGDELDLHGVPPREVDALVDAFIEVALARRRPRVRIIHGKGIGQLRQRVRTRLSQNPGVAAFADSAAPGSGWGATEIALVTPPSAVAPDAPAD